MNYAEELRQDLMLLLLDFEKACNRISWMFMQEVLRKQGFYKDFIRRVMTLYRNVASTIIVNGEVGAEFDLSQSVRQGCHLAPFLFNIVVLNALGFMLEDPRYEVEGLTLPGGSKVTHALFLRMTRSYSYWARSPIWTKQGGCWRFSALLWIPN